MKFKICLLGESGVGKTSLVSQFVHSVFKDQYLTTIGVKIDKKPLKIDGKQVDLLVWDIAGGSDSSKNIGSYLKGARGLLLVADGTRADTIAYADQMLEDKDLAWAKSLPKSFLVNKSDLVDKWEWTEEINSELNKKYDSVAVTSAKSGHFVEDAFVGLARSMLAQVKTD